MILPMSERFAVLRNKVLESNEQGDEAPGSEVFDAVYSCLVQEGKTDPALDLSLQDSLSRKIGWGEDPTTMILDCDQVCQRLLSSVEHAFPDLEEVSHLLALITEVVCAVARHITRSVVAQSGKERAQERRERMIQRQLMAAIEQQELLLGTFDTEG